MGWNDRRVPASAGSEQTDHAHLSRATPNATSMLLILGCEMRVKCTVWDGYYVTLWLMRAAHGMLRNSPRHSEIVALCQLWLCAAAALDEANDTTVADLSLDRTRIRSTQIGTDSVSVLRSVRSLACILSSAYWQSDRLSFRIFTLCLTRLIIRLGFWVGTRF